MQRRPAAFAGLIRRRARGSIAFAAVVLLWVCHAPASTVAILRPAQDSREVREALFRLKGELLAVGLEVVSAERPPGSSGGITTPEAQAWLEQLAAERRLDAVLDVVGARQPRAVEVWFRERGTHKLRVARVELEVGAEDGAGSLAIHAIEALRSSFVSLDAPGPQRAEPPASRAELSAELRRQLGFELGATALGGLDGVGLSVLPLLRLDWALDSRVVVHAAAAGFGTVSRIEARAGSVLVAQQFALVGACWCREAVSGVGAVAALSLGFLRTSVEGRAAAPARAHRAASAAFVLEVSAGLRAPLSSRYFLTLAAHAQLAQPYVAIRVVDEVVATAGRPNLLVSFTFGAWR